MTTRTAANNPLDTAFHQTYGENTKVAKLYAIDKLYPCLWQPRRVIPASIRGEWFGDPEELPEVLSNWHLIVEKRLDQPIDLPTFLRAKGDIDSLEKSPAAKDDPMVGVYLSLVGLAADIFQNGLRDPISITPHKDGYLLVKGERRTLAHHLLNLHVSGDFSRLLAFEEDRLDIWAQADNGTHEDLNAIAKARQLSLLIMDMYRGDPGISFDAYETMILPGEPDRRFYAQVSNGNVYRIKQDYAQRLATSMGIRGVSADAIRQYRRLLEVPDAIWQQADD